MNTESVRLSQNIWTKPILVSILLVLFIISSTIFISNEIANYYSNDHLDTYTTKYSDDYDDLTPLNQTHDKLAITQIDPYQLETIYSPNTGQPQNVEVEAEAEPEPEPEPEPETNKTETWHTISIQKGMTLTSIFKENKINIKQMYQILKLGKITKSLETLQPNKNIYLATDKNSNIVKLNYPFAKNKNLQIEQINGKYFASIDTKQIQTVTTVTNSVINSSLMSAGEKSNISYSVLLKLAKIFENQIDFNKDIRKGDEFTIIFEEHMLGTEKIDSGNIIAAQIINNGKILDAFYYKDLDNQQGQYYKSNGQAIGNSFLTAPLKYTRISSKYNDKRVHPILHTIRAHKGIDYAAPTGTPISSASDGNIKFIGRRGGYGRTVEIQHGKKYSTLYAHLSRYGKNISKGTKVNQGQIIGYVGKSGLATGPHLHYEFRVNNKHINPIKAKEHAVNNISNQEKKEFNEHVKKLSSKISKQRQQLSSTFTYNEDNDLTT